MSYTQKITAARRILSDHYDSIGVDDESEKFFGEITAMGGTSDAALASITEADLVKAGLPPLLARQVVKTFGGATHDEVQKQIVVIDDNPVTLAARLKPADLVAEYDPNEPDNPFGARLMVISKGQPFLVFDDDGILDVQTSVKLLLELRDHYPPRNSVVVNGQVRQTYVVGVRPMRYADENPMVTGAMLRPDGYSDANVEWGLLDLNVRQLVRLAVTISGEIVAANKSEVDVFDTVVGKSFDDVGRRYPKAMLKYLELEGGEAVPKLKIQLKPPAPVAKA